MGKLVLIAGPNSSGKSRYAEALVSRSCAGRYYIATMMEQNAENHDRIEKHRAQRAHLAFETLELPHRVGDAPVTPESVVLLEDVSNLLANVVFERGGCGRDVLADIQQLRQRCGVLLAVTISGLCAGEYEGETAAYIRDMAWLNARLSDEADGVVKMRDGAAVWEKGAACEIF